jgi:putative cell wall-binding protein
MVAKHFFAAPRMIGLVSGATFADALSGGPLLGRFGGPMLLTTPGELSPVVLDYLNRYRSQIDDLMVLGGERAVSRQVADDALAALRG